MPKTVNIVFDGFTQEELEGMYEIIDLHSKDYEGKGATVNNTSLDVAEHVLPRPKKL